jgi:hypothetical protein
MRLVIAILSVSWACTGATKREHDSLPYRYVPPSPPELPAGCIGGSNNELSIGRELGSDPPVIVLDDDFLPCFGREPLRPRVAIWSDGTIVFARESVSAGKPIQELVQGTIPLNEVAKLVDDVADAVEHSPRNFDTNAPGGYEIDRGQTSLVVWNHDHWRAAIVTGASPDDFIRALTSSPPSPSPPPPPMPGSDELGTALVDLSAPSIPPPLRFAQAYKELLDARPAGGAAITRDELSVTFFPLRILGSEALAHERREIAWPAKLPQPPVDVDPCADDEECVRDIAPAHRELAENVRREIRESSFKFELSAHGRHFVARFDSHYHGERDILQLERCAAHLAK